MELDQTPRYTPKTVTYVRDGQGSRLPVLNVIFHPPGTHKGIIRPDIGALELKTARGSRWYGCENAYINSELRMIVVGFPRGFEEMAHWEKVPESKEI